MLVLSRKLDQEICIGNEIRIRIVKIKGNTVRIGIEAPGEVKIIRSELEFESNQRGQSSDLSSDPSDLNTADVAKGEQADGSILTMTQLDNDLVVKEKCDSENANVTRDHRQILPLKRKSTNLPSPNLRMREWVQQVTKPR